MDMWMVTTLSTVLPIVVVVLVLVKVFGGLQRQSNETQRLLATGMPAQGRVLALQMGGGTITVMGHRHLMLSVTLEVHPPGQPPYVTTVNQTVSELVVPSLQPGTPVQLRVDPAQPARVAIAGPGGAPGAAPAGYPGAPPAYGAGPAYGAQPMYGAPGGVGFAPPDVAGTMRRGMPFMIAMFAITTLPVLAILAYFFVDFGSFFHRDGQPQGGWCAAAARCCREVSGGSPACSGFEGGMMPVEGCRTAFDGYKSSAAASGRTCQ